MSTGVKVRFCQTYFAAQLRPTGPPNIAIGQAVRYFSFYSCAALKVLSLTIELSKIKYVLFIFLPVQYRIATGRAKENSFLNFLQVIWVKKRSPIKKVYFIIKKPQKSADFSQKTRFLILR